MKNLLLLLSLTLIFNSCDTDDDQVIESDIVGSWELVATYADPGDGSGNFQYATGKTLDFTAQNEVFCNVSFCFGSLTQATSRGTYSTVDQSIEADNCQGTYYFNGRYLEIMHPCIEPCIERYVRIP